MGTVYKPTATKPLPPGAAIIIRKGRRLARWKAANGKTRTAPLTVGKDGSDRIIIESAKWYCKYRDGSRIVRIVPTGCKDETAARQVLADLERRGELVRAGVMTSGEDAMSGHQSTPLMEH